jgi:hypothetical protein
MQFITAALNIMKTIKRLKLGIFILTFVYSSFVSILTSMANGNQPLDSVISLLTANIWYSAYTGDLPVSELSFEHIPNTLDSVGFENKRYRLVYDKSVFSLDSLWSLRGSEFSCFITVLNKDSVILIQQAYDAYIPDIILIHSKPQPSTTLAKDSLINKISGIWYSKENEGKNVRLERINSSPDSVSCSEYLNDGLISSFNYRVIFAYQKNWELINKNRLYFSIYIYDNEIVVSNCNTWGSLCDNIHFNRDKPSEIANQFSLSNQPVLYPNPCSGTITLLGNIDRVEIVELNGEVMLTKEFFGIHDRTIDITRISKGVYIVR